jgi:exonuclease SbcD
VKILHTSDWHLGRSLYGRKRYDEFAAFLDWLGKTIEEQAIDALLIAGDIFDTSTPSNRAQELYYRFLCTVAGSCCRHIVVIAGNHDSPSFLNAPRELLRALNVYVLGAITDDAGDEVIVLRNKQGEAEAIVCAVPYLRDRDIRIAMPGETAEDKTAKLIEGLRRHYAAVCLMAELKQKELAGAGSPADVPVIAMGHLFAAGGKTAEGDGVRELYVGSLAHVGRDVFPAVIDYLALGHLHVPQMVGGAAHIRYSGSPLPLGFGEAGQQKKVVVVAFSGGIPAIEEVPVPCFQVLERIVGSLDALSGRIEQLKGEQSRAWLEIEYTGAESVGNLRELLDDALAGSFMEIRRIRNRRIMDRVMSGLHEDETLDDLDVDDVFVRCLDTFAVPPEDHFEMTRAYNEIIESLHEDDVNAE